MGDPAQCAVGARPRGLRDAAVTHWLEYFDFEHQEFELEVSALSVEQFEGVLREAAPCVTYVPIDLDGQVGIVVDVPVEVYELVRLIIHLDQWLCAEYGGGLPHPRRA